MRYDLASKISWKGDTAAQALKISKGLQAGMKVTNMLARFGTPIINKTIGYIKDDPTNFVSIYIYEEVIFVTSAQNVSIQVLLFRKEALKNKQRSTWKRWSKHIKEIIA